MPDGKDPEGFSILRGPQAEREGRGPVTERSAGPSTGTCAEKGEPSAPRVPRAGGHFSEADANGASPSQEQLANSTLSAKGPGSESRSGVLSYFLSTPGFTGPSLSELISSSKTSAWFLQPPVKPNASRLSN